MLRPLAHTAHPRSRGENKLRAVLSLLTDGSSPLTRGKHVGVRSADQPPRLIPAHAGKTGHPLTRGRRGRSHPRSRGENTAGDQPLRPRGAHPRSRGENQAVSEQPREQEGSSPLTRGKRVVVRANRLDGRLIPAHAGKTPNSKGEIRREEAHPRSRGENLSRPSATPSRRGSSPLTRGKHGSHGLVNANRGLIPAHAGKTRSRR